ncbi:MAG: hypothetical protein NVS2B11_04760 [Acetobacteraceae bacterium]
MVAAAARLIPPSLHIDALLVADGGLTVRAIDLAMERAVTHGTATVVIRRSHHIACLAAYLRRATDRGLVLLLMSSDPSVRSVAPYGGARALFTPNPIAAGYPTDGEPVLMDISTSTTTNGLTNRLKTEGRRLEEPWLLDAAGHPSDDPAVLFTDPPGTIQPLGGPSAGHKGFAPVLLVETLTGALGGFGRADPAEGWGASVFVQVIDPDAFGGRAPFLRETAWMADAVRATPPIAGPNAKGTVRLPGARGLHLREQQARDGVRLYPSIMPALQPWADRLHVKAPTPLP